MSVALVIDRVARSFGERRVLKNVSFEARQGELVLITGNNGSGKSTLFEIITGQIAASAGRIAFSKGSSLPVAPALVAWERIHRRPRSGMRVCRQSAPLFRSLSLAEHMSLAESVSVAGGRGQQSIITLDRYAADNRSPEQMSFGERRAFAIERQIAGAPRVCLLDEPFAGLDRANSERLTNNLELAKRAGVICVVIEHRSNIPRFSQLVDRAYELSDGSLRQLSVTDMKSAGGADASAEPAAIGRRMRNKGGDVGLEITVATRRPDACPPLFAEIGASPLLCAGGEVVRISAPNGWGKSTLCSAILGAPADFPATVGVRSGDRDLSGRDTEGRYAAGLRLMRTAPQYPARTRVADLFSVAGVAGSARSRPLMSRHFQTLSGGEMRFVTLELALGNGGVHCILDEPLLGLDMAAQADAENLIEEFQGRGSVLILEPRT